MASKLCKLCLFKCEINDENHIEWLIDVQNVIKIVNDLFHQMVVMTSEEALLICHLCRQKLIDFYEYYKFVLENQIKYQSLLDVNVLETTTNDEIPKPDVVFLVKEEIVSGNILLNSKKETEIEVKVEPNVCLNVIEEEQKVSKKVVTQKKKPKSGDEVEKRPRGRPSKPKTEKQLTYMAEDALINKYFKLKCDKCKSLKRDFPRYRDLHYHMRERHFTHVTLECCGIQLLSRINTVRHCNDHECPTKCDDCDQSFAGRQVLKNHVAEVHNKKIPLDDRVFICNECGKTKVEKKNIWHHLKTVHFNENTHVCEVCAVVYKTRSSLEMHIRVAHKNIKLPRTQCEHCGKWIQKRHLNNHIRNHFSTPEPVTCKECGRECKSKKSLQKHIRKIHSPLSKKYQCTYCPKAFVEAITLKEHVATHTGVSLYYCEFCGAQFKSNGNYSAHKRRLHPMEYSQQKLANQIKREQLALGLTVTTEDQNKMIA